MRILIELLLTLLLVFFTVKCGWPWPIIFIVAYLFAFDRKLLFLSKRARLRTRFLVFLAIFLSTAFFIGGIINDYLFMDEVQAEVIKSSKLLTFLLAPDALKVFWSAVGGITITGILSALTLWSYGSVASQSMYGQYDQYQGHEREATLSAISILLGINRGTWLVNNGKAQVLGESGSSLTRFGGPGILITQEGHAVILEKSGKLSRVVGRGITWLEPFERISMVVPLQTRSEHIIVEQVATKDQILIEEFEFWVFHKVDPGPEEEQTENGQYPFSESILLKKVWSMSGNDWRGGIKAVSETAARDVVGRYDLEQILPIAGKPRVDFKDALKREINRVMKDFMGVDVVVVDIGKIKVPEEAEKRLLEKWLADWSIKVAQSEREAMIRKGEAEAVIMKVKEVAWAEAQRQVIEEITAGFNTMGLSNQAQIPYLIAIRSLETLEKMARDPATKILLPANAIVQLQELRQAVSDGTPALIA